MPVDPVQALLLVALVANAVLMVVLVVPWLLGRREPSERGSSPGQVTGAVRLAAVTGRPEPYLFDDGVPQRAYDRVVRIVAWTYILAAAAIVAVSGLWPDTQSAIFVLLAAAGLFLVVVHDLLSDDALGSARPIVEGSVAVTFASLLVLLTGQVASPFFFTFPLIVAGAALVVRQATTVALATAASIGYLVAVLLPVDAASLDAAAIATIAINLTALLLITYVAMVIAREQRRTREAAIRLSTIDSLTGLFNRSFLLAAIEREIARSSRSGRGFCLLMMDLDELKRVNDEHGHHIGDRILRGVGDEIRTGVRRIDTPSRFGGDEFVVLCPETDPSGAFILAEKIRQGIAGLAVDVPGALLRPSVSVGVVAYPFDGASADSLLISADRAMYLSKRAGRDRVSTTASAAGRPVPVGPGPGTRMAPGGEAGRPAVEAAGPPGRPV